MSPLYDYECTICGHQFESQQSINTPLLGCILCGRPSKRVILKPILTCLPANQRRWGTSLYRSHDKGEKIGKKKLPEHIPVNLKGDEQQ